MTTYTRYYQPKEEITPTFEVAPTQSVPSTSTITKPSQLEGNISYSYEIKEGIFVLYQDILELDDTYIIPYEESNTESLREICAEKEELDHDKYKVEKEYVSYNDNYINLEYIYFQDTGVEINHLASQLGVITVDMGEEEPSPYFIENNGEGAYVHLHDAETPFSIKKAEMDNEVILRKEDTSYFNHIDYVEKAMMESNSFILDSEVNSEIEDYYGFVIETSVDNTPSTTQSPPSLIETSDLLQIEDEEELGAIYDSYESQKEMPQYEQYIPPENEEISSIIEETQTSITQEVYPIMYKNNGESIEAQYDGGENGEITINGVATGNPECILTLDKNYESEVIYYSGCRWYVAEIELPIGKVIHILIPSWRRTVTGEIIQNTSTVYSYTYRKYPPEEENSDIIYDTSNDIFTLNDETAFTQCGNLTFEYSPEEQLLQAYNELNEKFVFTINGLFKTENIPIWVYELPFTGTLYYSIEQDNYTLTVQTNLRILNINIVFNEENEANIYLPIQITVDSNVRTIGEDEFQVHGTSNMETGSVDIYQSDSGITELAYHKDNCIFLHGGEYLWEYMLDSHAHHEIELRLYPSHQNKEEGYNYIFQWGDFLMEYSTTSSDDQLGYDFYLSDSHGTTYTNPEDAPAWWGWYDEEQPNGEWEYKEIAYTNNSITFIIEHRTITMRYNSIGGELIELTTPYTSSDMLFTCNTNVGSFSQRNAWVIDTLIDSYTYYHEVDENNSDDEEVELREQGKFIFNINEFDSSSIEGNLSMAGIYATFTEDGTILHAEVEDTSFTDKKWWGMGLEKDTSEGLIRGAIQIQSGIKGINFEFIPNEDESIPNEVIPLDEVISDTSHTEEE